jgi:hypothetical protein
MPAHVCLKIVEYTQLAPSDNRSTKSADGRVATEAAWLKCKTSYREEKEKAEMKLLGKVALLTGGNSGIGLATANQFVKEGAYIFITGRRETELAAAAKEIGRNVTAIPGDVSNLVDLDRLFGGIRSEKGRLDIVFANVGILRPAPLWERSQRRITTRFLNLPQEQTTAVTGDRFTVKLRPDLASLLGDGIQRQTGYTLQSELCHEATAFFYLNLI